MKRLTVALGTLCAASCAQSSALFQTLSLTKKRTKFSGFALCALLPLFGLIVFSGCSKDIQTIKEPPSNPTDTTSDGPPIISTNGPVDFITLYNGSKNTKNLPVPAFFANTGLAVPTGLLRDTLTLIPGCTDYAPVIFQKLHHIALTPGGGTLYITHGEYPVLSEVLVTLYDTYSSTVSPVSILGEAYMKNDRIMYPLFYDSTNVRQPHRFLTFECTPDDDTKEIYINGLAILGNNVPVSNGNHPYIGVGAEIKSGIRFANINRGGIKNTIVTNIYGDGIQITNWSPAPMDNVNIGQGIEIDNCYLINNWGDNGLTNSGDGVMFWHVNNPILKNTVISTAFSQTHYYGRMGVVLEAGTKNGQIQNCFIQGYRDGIRCELDFGGHQIKNNLIGKNRIAGITFAQSQSIYDSFSAADFAKTFIVNNVFVYGQLYSEFNANHSSFINMSDHGFTLQGMEIIGNSFNFYEQSSPANRLEHISQSHPYSVYIQTHGQTGLTILDNTYN